MAIGGVGDSSYSMDALFGTASSSQGGLTSLLGDFNSIQNGSYGKLMRSYYSQSGGTDAISGTSGSASDMKKEIIALKDHSDALKKAVSELSDGKLFEEKEITTVDPETGEETVTKDYDRDAIKKALTNFVEAYNSFVEKAGDSDSKGILRETMWLTNIVKSNSGLLEDVGVKVGSDNKLSIDEDDLKAARITDLKTLFQGPNSLTNKIQQKVSMVNLEIKNIDDKLAKTYTGSGSYANQLLSGASYDEWS